MKKTFLMPVFLISFLAPLFATAVASEAALVDTEGISVNPTVSSQVLYETVKGRDVSAELAFVVSIRQDSSVGVNQAADVETSTMSRGELHKWISDRMNGPLVPQAAEVEAAKIRRGEMAREIIVEKNKNLFAPKEAAPVGTTPEYSTFPTPVQIQISAILHGQGASFRRWVPQRFVLSIPGTNTRLSPMESIKIYIQKQSAITPVAPYLFGAMGAMYEGPGAQAANNPGTACPVTGEGQGGGSQRGDTAQAIDRAGMAAGLGLLTSTAKGELEGQKLTFSLDAMPSDGKFLLQFEALNKDKHTTETLSVPVDLGIYPPNRPTNRGSLSHEVKVGVGYRE